MTVVPLWCQHPSPTSGRRFEPQLRIACRHLGRHEITDRERSRTMSATPGWAQPDVFADDLDAWADEHAQHAITRREARVLRRVARKIRDQHTGADA